MKNKLLKKLRNEIKELRNENELLKASLKNKDAKIAELRVLGRCSIMSTQNFPWLINEPALENIRQTMCMSDANEMIETILKSNANKNLRIL